MKHLTLTRDTAAELFLLPTEKQAAIKKALEKLDEQIDHALPSKVMILGSPKEKVDYVIKLIAEHYVMERNFIKGNQPTRVTARSTLVGILKSLGYTHDRIGQFVEMPLQSVTRISTLHAKSMTSDKAYEAAFDSILRKVRETLA